MGMSVEEYRKIISAGERGGIKSATRQLQGKINREYGKYFEEQIEAICEIYRLNNLAIIEKTPEPMKIIKHIENGHFETVFEKSAQPDFKGVIKGGRTVVFDAKFTEADRIKYQVLSDFQREELLGYHALGAMTFVLVGFLDGKMYPVDIEIWDQMKEKFGRKYIKQEELDEMNLRAKTTKGGVTDFLKICTK